MMPRYSQGRNALVKHQLRTHSSICSTNTTGSTKSYSPVSKQQLLLIDDHQSNASSSSLSASGIDATGASIVISAPRRRTIAARVQHHYAEQLNIEEEAEERDTEVPHAAHARTRIVRTARNFPAPMLYLENIAPRWQEHARGDGAMYFLENKLQLLDVRFSHLQQPSTSQN